MRCIEDSQFKAAVILFQSHWPRMLSESDSMLCTIMRPIQVDGQYRGPHIQIRQIDAFFASVILVDESNLVVWQGKELLQYARLSDVARLQFRIAAISKAWHQ